jgi:hypothetical protein
VPASAQPIPNKVIWAWQRPEDLSYIDPHEFAVAYLACHALLTDGSLREHWRDQPLRVPPDAVLMPVLRIDTDQHRRASLSEEQIERLLPIVSKIAKLPRTAQVQIDFDAVESERNFYRRLLQRIRAALPETQISMTALASWCLFDDWIRDLPVAEMVPMLFSLGAERQKILLYFRTHGDFLVPTCGNSLGLSLEDTEVNQLMIPIAKRRTIPVRFYFFSKTRWTEKKLDTLRKILNDK